ncbi:hypothetical protein EDB86DRAFT_2908802, partial [Lactarius hatsudake]
MMVTAAVTQPIAMPFTLVHTWTTAATVTSSPTHAAAFAANHDNDGKANMFADATRAECLKTATENHPRGRLHRCTFPFTQIACCWIWNPNEDPMAFFTEVCSTTTSVSQYGRLVVPSAALTPTATATATATATTTI